MSVHISGRTRSALADIGESTTCAAGPGERRGAGRMTGIDAARGIAMLLVCVSHVRVHFVDVAPSLYLILTAVTRIATPTFLLLSGFVAAYVLASNRPNIRMTLFDRGLFVLLVGHFVLNWDDLRYVGVAEWAVARVTVTDAIGICLMSAVFLHRLPARVLAALGAALALLSWPIAMFVAPESDAARYIGAALFDLRSEANGLIDAAIVPYMGVFLIGMALSKSSIEILRHGHYSQMARKLAVFGGIALVAVGVGILGWFLFKSFGLTSADQANTELIKRALDPRSKLPPGPAYLLFYGGSGLLIAAICLVPKPKALVEPIVRWFATIGRASLMSFVVQDWLLVALPGVVGFDTVSSMGFWLAYLAMTIVAIHWLAARWDSAGANRFLTLGLKNRQMALP